MSSNETYSIKIRAYSRTNETSDSDAVKVSVYPEPDNIIFLNNSAYSLKIQWSPAPFIQSYIIQYSLLISNEWKDIGKENIEEVDDTVVIQLKELKPKTQYKFRLSLMYPQNKNIYIWPKDLRFTFETLGTFS